MHNCGVSHLSSPLLMTLSHKIVPTFFQKRGTRLQANSVKVEQNKGGATPFFLLDFCSINTCLVQLIRFKTLRIFCHSLDPRAQFLFSQCFTNYLLKDEYQIFSILVRTSAELNKLPYVIYKSRTAGQDSIMTEGKTSAVVQDLNKIHLKNKIFSFRQLLSIYGFQSQ